MPVETPTPSPYEELIDFLAAGTTPASLAAFRASAATRQRVEHLVERAKRGELTPEDASELGHYVELEHIVRLAKARARRHLECDGT